MLQNIWSKSSSKLRHLPTVMWKNLLFLVFCQGFKFTLSMHSCKVRKELFLLSPSFQAFCFLAFCILYVFRGSFYLLLLPHNMGFRFCPRIRQFRAHPFLMVCSLLTSYGSFSCVSSTVSLPQGRWLMSQPQGVAIGIGDWEDVSEALIQTGPANLSLLCHH